MDFVGMIQEWWSIFTLKTPMKKVAKSYSFNDGAINVVLSGVIIGLLATVLTLGLGFVAVFFAPISSLISWVIGAVVYYVFAVIVGGKGKLDGYAGALGVVSAPVAVLSTIPVVGFIASIYGFYLNYLLVKVYFKLDTGRALMVVLLPLALTLLVVFVVAGAFIAGLGGGLLGGLFGDSLAAVIASGLGA